MTRNVCSAIWRRARQQETTPEVDALKPGLSPRTVCYVRNILHSALIYLHLSLFYTGSDRCSAADHILQPALIYLHLSHYNSLIY